MTKEIIIKEAEDSFASFGETCTAFDTIAFSERPGGKWSVAENTQHLILSLNTTTLAFALPKLLVKLIGGISNRDSHSYDELLARYDKKIAEGATASKRYIPKPIAVKYGKDILLQRWKAATAKFIRALSNNRTEQDLDHYIVKHPLLGPVTLRELCYFTIFHTKHHLISITKRMKAENDPVL